MDKAVIYLPFNNNIFFYGHTNAVFQQEIEVSFEDGTKFTMKGNGEANKSTTPAQYVKATPETGKFDKGFQATVKIFHKNANDTQWKPSNFMAGRTILEERFTIAYFLAEDGIDIDYNDILLQMIWFGV